VSPALHLHPTADLAERVLLPGDPGRALLLAQSLLEEPKMFNHNRGLWGYTGVARDGEPLTVQSTGMGGPSAAIVVWELAELGARRMLRVGTCGAFEEPLALGDLVIATEALSADGTSRALGSGERARPSAELLAALQRAAADDARVHRGPVVTTDLFYDERSGLEQQWIDAGAVAVEMEAATVLTLAAKRGLQAGAVLAVSDVLRPARTRIDAEELRAVEHRLGDLAIRALPALVAD
jgi:DeoD family purine-nucleoside phosphorylase